MAVLGKGHVRTCSLLHAAGNGYGAAMALDLPVIVRLLDKPSKREVHDSDGVLPALGCMGQRWTPVAGRLPTRRSALGSQIRCSKETGPQVFSGCLHRCLTGPVRRHRYVA